MRKLLTILCSLLFLGLASGNQLKAQNEFELTIDQTLNPTRDSLYVDLFIRLTGTTPWFMGASNFAFNHSLTTLPTANRINNSNITSLGGFDNNPANACYLPTTMGGGAFTTLNTQVVTASDPATCGILVTSTRTQIGRVAFKIADCNAPNITWRTAGTVNKWNGPSSFTNITAQRTFTNPIAWPGTYSITPASLNICSGSILDDIDLSDSDLNMQYEVYQDAVATGIIKTGTGSPLTFTVADLASITGLSGGEVFTVVARYSSTGGPCETTLGGTATAVDITPSITAGPVSVCDGVTSVVYTSDLSGTWSSINLTGTASASLTAGPSVSTSVDFTGVGTVRIYVDNGGCKDSIDVTVNDVPTITTSTASVCDGATGVSYVSDIIGVWTAINATGTAAAVITGSPGTSVTVDFTGVGTIDIQVDNNGCTDVVTVTVNDVPTITTSTASVCDGATGVSYVSDISGVWTAINATGTAAAVITGSPSTSVTVDFTGVGTIDIQVDNNGCTDVVTVTVNDVPTITTSTASVCDGATGVSYVSDISGVWTAINATGTAAAVITGSPGTSVTVDFTGVGTIDIQVDNNGCTDVVTVTVNDVPTITTSTASVCDGATGVSYVSDISGVWTAINATGTAAAVITGSPGTSVTVDFTGVGTIDIQVDNNGCTDVVTVTVNDVPTITTSTASVCDGATGVSYVSDISGVWTAINATGTAAAVITGSPGTSVTVDFTGVGTIDIQVDNNGCTDVVTVTVNDVPTITTSTASVCDGATGVSYVSDISGVWTAINATGTAAAVITGSPGTSVTVDFTGVGTIDIQVDNNGCTDVVTVTVNDVPTITTSTASVCDGATGVSYVSDISGVWTAINATGTAAAVITGSPGTSVTVDFTGLGTIDIQVDNNGCTDVVTVTVNDVPTITTSTASVCDGATGVSYVSDISGVWTAINATGTAAAVITGSPSTSVTVDFTGVGTIDIQVDNNGCTDVVTVTVNDVPTITTSTASVCDGATGVSYVSDISGVWTAINATGTAAAVITGSPGTSVTVDFTGVGTIDIQVDNNGCTDVVTVTVNDVPTITTSTASVCDGATGVSYVSDISGVWTAINATGTAAAVITGSPGTSVTVDFTGVGTIDIQVDNNGCTDVVTVTVNDVPTITTSTASVCDGATGVSYVSDISGVWTAINATGTAAAVITGSPGTSVTVDFTGVGTIDIQVDNNGCTDVVTVTVNDVPTITTSTASVCDGATGVSYVSDISGVWTAINATGTAAAVITGSPGTSVTVDFTGVGTIDIQVDNNGCTDVITVTVNDVPTITTSTASVCDGATGVSYVSDISGVWTAINATGTAAAVITGSPSTSVTVDFTGVGTIDIQVDNNGCTDVVTVTVNDVPTITTSTASVCDGATGVSYVSDISGVWTAINATGTAAAVITGSPSTSVTVDFTGVGTIDIQVDNNGCTDVVTVTVNDVPTITTSTASVCDGATGVSYVSDISGVWTAINATGTAAAVITGSPGTSVTVDFTGVGTIDIQVDNNGCTDVVTVTVNDVPTITTSTASVCDGATGVNYVSDISGVWTAINATGTAAAVITGSPGTSVTVDFTGVGTIDIQVDNNGCTDVVTVTVNDVPTITTSTASVCDGATGVSYVSDISGVWTAINATGTAAAVITGSPSTSVTVDFTGVGTIDIQVDNNGCTDVVTVTVNDVPTITTSTASVCDGATGVSYVSDISGVWTAINATGTAAAVITGSPGTSVTVDFTGVGTIDIQVDNNGCTDVVTVTVNDVPTITTSTASVCDGATGVSYVSDISGVWTAINATGTAAAVITGSPGTSVTVDFTGVGTIDIQVDNNGCTDVVTVTVNDVPTITTSTASVCDGATGVSYVSDISGVWTAINATGTAAAVITGSPGTSVTVDFTGVGTIDIQVDNNGCTDVVTVTVNDVPTITTSTASVCDGATGVSYVSDISGVWTAINATGTAAAVITGSPGTSVTVDFTGVGTIDIQVDNNGCTDVVTVTVNDVPTITTSTASVCDGATGVSYVSDISGVWTAINATGTAAAVITGSPSTSVTVDFTGVGTIDIQVDNNGCTDVVTVTVNDVPTITTSTASVCDGATGVSYVSDISGVWTAINATGTAAAVITGSPGTSVTVDFTGVGTIDIQVDNNGCTDVVTVTVNDVPTITTSTASVCDGATGVSYVSDISGVWTAINATGTAAAVITGSPSTSVTVDFTGVGTIDIQVDNNGCTDVVTVTVNDVPTITTSTASVCDGATGVSYVSDIIGVWTAINATGTAAAVITGSPGTSVTVDFTGVGTIDIQVDNNGCTDVVTVTVNDVPTITTSTASVCDGATGVSYVSDISGVWTAINATGTAAAVITGSPSTSVTVDFTGVGTIDIQVDNNGCTDVVTVTVNDVPTITTSTASVCDGATGVSYVSDISGVWTAINATGTAAAVITGSPGTSVTVDFTGVGTIDIQVDNNGCTDVVTVTVNDVPTITTSTASVCDGATGVSYVSDISGVWTAINATGTAAAVITGSPSTSVTVDFTGVGTIDIQVDNNGCTDVVTVTVNDVPTITTSTASVCDGATGVSYVSDISGVWTAINATGTAAAVITGSPGTSVTVDFTGVGTIDIQVDNNGCTDVVTVTVNDVPTITTSTASVCDGATGVSYVSDISGVWTAINATGTAAAVITGSPGTSVTVDFTGVGTIDIQVDNNGCTDVVTVTVNDVPTITTSTASVCDGATGVSYVSDISGVWTAINATGTAAAVITGSPGTSVTVDFTGVGTIDIQVDNNGCTDVVTVTVNDVPTITTSTASVCDGATGVSYVSDISGVWTAINATGTAAAVITGSPGTSVTVDFTGVGTIDIQVDNNGCTDVVTVTVNDVPTITTSTASVCDGATGVSYVSDISGVWTAINATGTAAAVITGSPSTSVTVDFTGVGTIDIQVDNNGCTDVVTVTVNDVPTITTSTASVCDGATGVSYVSDISGVWTAINATGTAAAVITGSPSTSVTVDFTGVGTIDIQVDNNGCTDVVTVTVNDVPTITTSTASVCDGATGVSYVSDISGVWTAINATGTAAAVITGSPGTSVTVDFTGVGTIDIQVDNNGCTDVVTVTVNDVPTITTSTASVCDGATGVSYVSDISGVWTAINATGTAAAVITGSPSTSVTVDFTGVGTIDIQVDNNGCTDVVTVTVNDVPTITTSTASVCDGATGVSYVSDISGVWTAINATGTAAAVITGSPGTSVTVDFTGVGTIDIQVDNNGCTDVVTVTVNPAITNATFPADFDLCDGSTGNIAVTITGGVGPFDITIDNGVGTIIGYVSGTPINISPSVGSFTYNITSLTDQNGCSFTATDQITVNVNPNPTITLGSSPVVCEDAFTADLPYTLTTGSPDQYSIDFDAAAEAAGLVDVGLTALPASPISFAVAGVIPGTYNATITVVNSTTTCSSTPIGFTVTVNVIPNPSFDFSQDPSCANNDGQFGVTGFAASTNYNVSYDLDGVPVGPIVVTSNVSGEINLTGLSAGHYKNFIFADAITGCSGSEPNPHVLLISGLKFSANVLLMGADPDEDGTMSNSLGALLSTFENGNGGDPSSYGPIEMGFSQTVPGNAVDVVKIELRTAPNAAPTTSGYAWLLTDGSIVDFQSGSGEVNICGASAGDYFIVIKHRNHLPIITEVSVTLATSPFGSPYDMTSAINLGNQASGAFYEASGFSYMWMGNAYDDPALFDVGEVNASDFIVVSLANDVNPSGVYTPEDLNLDGDVNADDFTAVQLGNDNLYYTPITQPELNP